MERFNQIGLFILLIVIGFLYRRYYDNLEKELQLRDLYLINTELLEKSKKPILWISVPREYNSKNWSSFYSRSSYDLNIPYLYLTIKSIIDTCASSFTICIIDDNSFSKLLPDWTPELDKIGDPLKSKVRYLGIMQLMHKYGGLLVPPSFLALENLYTLYEQSYQKTAIVEGVNYYNCVDFTVNPNFIACQKNDKVIGDCIEYLRRMISNDYTAESIFLNDIAKWFNLQYKQGNILKIDGKYFGIKNAKGKVVLPDNLMSSSPLELFNNKYGIYIPHKEIEKRNKFNWFCYLNKDEIKLANIELSKYF